MVTLLPIGHGAPREAFVVDELEVVEEFKVGVELHAGPGPVRSALAVPTPFGRRGIVLGGDGVILLGVILPL